ncbi:hypothetical protein [Luteibacter aegosomatissinici]|uniref:hypothetical protein n=1 Tax=Luteibacter aegosomatissinici TaxID=2911539 RepID=UPI001FF9F439|nr:hypothetical protein [Luteibacter aegosomatissinici]UPG92849.1 hypothetical protein L2Y97_13340 [Luteibacter aegosomatissinici]
MTHPALARDCTALLFTAIAMNEAALERDFDELRFLAHAIIADAPHVLFDTRVIHEAASALIRALGPNGERPARDFGLALNALTEAVHCACSTSVQVPDS